MSSLVNVAIHSSQFPEKVRADFLASLRGRAVNHKFHYDSVKQTQKWLALHQAFSPSRNDPAGAAVYDRAFAAAASDVRAAQIHLIGLGCGGGQKDSRLLRLFKDGGSEVFYTPCDVSAAMVLTARAAALSIVAENHCFPLVCDLPAVDDLPAVFRQPAAENAARVVTFFGMIPNFEPEIILPKLASLIRPEDVLLFSANLAPGADYEAGVKTVLPQYDNPLTRDWLLAFLFDLGVAPEDGELRFAIEDVGELKRIVARFHFTRNWRVKIDGEEFNFHPGESIRLFYSYRYTPKLVSDVLARHGLRAREQWITPSAEEGVFLCGRRER